MNRKRLIAAFIAFFTLGACSLLPRWGNTSYPMMPGIGGWQSNGYASNGERIYYTGTNEDGQWVPYSGGPSYGGMMMGARLNCASCHGADGKGGIHAMHMDVMDAPDIRLQALQSASDKHGDTEGEHIDEHAEAHADYDLEDFRQAVVLGQHLGGDSLDRDMPRWELSDQDLADLFEFLSNLP